MNCFLSYQTPWLKPQGFPSHSTPLAITERVKQRTPCSSAEPCKIGSHLDSPTATQCACPKFSDSLPKDAHRCRIKPSRARCSNFNEFVAAVVRRVNRITVTSDINMTMPLELKHALEIESDRGSRQFFSLFAGHSGRILVPT